MKRIMNFLLGLSTVLAAIGVFTGIAISPRVAMDFFAATFSILFIILIYIMWVQLNRF